MTAFSPTEIDAFAVTARILARPGRKRKGRPRGAGAPSCVGSPSGNPVMVDYQMNFALSVMMRRPQPLDWPGAPAPLLTPKLALLMFAFGIP